MPNDKAGFLDKAISAVKAGAQAYQAIGKAQMASARSPEKKDDAQIGVASTDRDYLSFFAPQFMRANYDITFYQAVVYYCHVHPIATGIDAICDEFERIKPVMMDTDKNQIEKTDHDLLELLRFPNSDVSGYEFQKQLAAYLKITGNVYIMATGGFPKPPLELFIIQPQRVTMSPAWDGFVASYTVNIGNQTGHQFVRKEIDGRFRFFDKEGNELWHIREFNPRLSPSQLYGLSRLTACYWEIEQHLQGNKHNLSLLTNGVTASGALIVETELSDDQRQRLKTELSYGHQGAENAGKPFLFDGTAKAHWEQMRDSAKDMDFLSNRSAMAMAIFNRLKVPLPLVSPDHMTMNNFEQARLSLYDNAVLPLTDMLFGELTEFLRPRYKIKPNEKLSYDANDIPALEPRRNENISSKVKSGVLTINECRTLYGYEAIENGDTLYQPATLVPIGQDRYTEDNLKDPKPKVKSKEEMARVLRLQIESDGRRRFSDEQIKMYLEKLPEAKE